MQEAQNSQKIFGHEEFFTQPRQNYYFQVENEYGLYDFYDNDDPYTIPDSCRKLLWEQFKRFNIPLTEDLQPLLDKACFEVFDHFSHFFPYDILDVSDISAGDHQNSFQYRIFNSRRQSASYDASPEDLEVFFFVPGQSERVFGEILSKPSLEVVNQLDIEFWKNRPRGGELGTIHPKFWGHNPYDEEWDDVIEATLPELERLFPQEDRRKLFQQYAEMAAWAAMAWMVGPLSREERRTHPLIDAVMTHGEAIMYKGYVYEPSNYERQERAPRSCHRCGIRAWCAEITLEEDYSTLICEGCLNQGMPPMNAEAAEWTCGTKLCRYTGCHHHPLHHLGSTAFREVMRKSGQLNAVARGDAPIGVMGDEGLALLE